MALDDLKGVTTATGTYRYDGTQKHRIHIIARSYDVKYATYAADGLLEDGEKPAAPGYNGLYYYVSGTGPFPTEEEAVAWAERSWGPIRWSIWRRLLSSLSRRKADHP